MIKKITKWIAISLLILLATLTVLYTSAPYWVPSQLQQFLPQTLKLEELQIEHPGLTHARIPALSLTINTGSPIKLELSEVELHYSVWQKKLIAIKADKAKIHLSKNQSSAQEFSNKIPLPTLPLEQLNITRLTISGLLVQDITITDLAITAKKQIINATGSANLAGLPFEIETTATSEQELLQNLTAKIEHQNDSLDIKLKPYQDQGFSWQLTASLNNNSILPIDALQPIQISGSGNFIKGGKIYIELEPNFTIHTQLDSETLQLREQLSELLEQQQIQVDLAQITEPILLQSQLEEALHLTISNDNLITIAQGKLPLLVQHPMSSLQVVLEKLQLDANQSLASSEQIFHGSLEVQTQLDNLIYSDTKNRIKSKLLELSFNSNFQIEQSVIKAASQALQLKLDNSQLNLPTVASHLDRVSFSGDFTVTQDLTGAPNPDQVSLNLQQDNAINLGLVSNSETVHFTKLFNTIKLNNESLSVTSKANSINLVQQDLTLNNVKVTSHIQLNNSSMRGKFTSNKVNFSNEQVSLQDLIADIDWQLSKDDLHAKGIIHHDSLRLPFEYQFNLKSSSHQFVNKKASIPATQIANWLNPLLSEFPDLSISQGEITTQNLHLDPLKLSGQGVINIASLDLSYDKLELINLQLNEVLSNRAPLTGKAQISIDAINLASGIAITNISSKLAHRQGIYHFNDIYADFLKGSFAIDKVSIAPNKITPFVAKLNAIDLELLLKAFDSESLHIEGRFDFDLPININDKGQSITDGTFASIERGILKVVTADATNTNIAFQALDNFHYDSLAGTINYSEKGIYQLRVELKGNNPELYDGFPIELTLNIEGNLPNLLQSMLVSGDMAKPIIDKYHSGGLDLPDTNEP